MNPPKIGTIYPHAETPNNYINLTRNEWKPWKHVTESSNILDGLIVQTLDEKQVIDNSYDFALSLHVDHQAVVGVIKSLETDLLIATEQLSQQFWELTEEARSVIQEGSPGMF